jgi:AbrB family looped-hinge helix DNA binding protein
MNLHPIVTPNPKGQLIIPLAIRKALKLQPTSPFEVSTIGDQIILKPIYALKTSLGSHEHYLELLQSTQGSWAEDPDDHQKKHQFELQATAKAKQAW